MAPSEGQPPGLPFGVRLVLIALGVAISGWLLWMGTVVHLARACVVMDTPYLPLCNDTAAVPAAERQRQLRSRLAANPADSTSWIQLANLEAGTYQKALLRAAFALAPNDPNVLMWRAGDVLADKQLPQAVELLVQLVEYRNRGEAAQALAHVVASGEGTALLHPHLPSASRWLPQVLASLGTLKLPLSSALPLMAGASATGVVTKQTTQLYIRALRDAGLWGDAYGLWLVQQKGPAPLLNNGRFDQPFQPDGFDWEITPVLPSRAGAVVSQRGSGNKGQVLDIQFTGRPLVIPILRQYVFAGPGKYVLRGQYMGSKLRMDEGLAWAARCTSGSAAPLAGRSEALLDTAGAWQSFSFPISIPANCGLVFSLQLETSASSAASAGARGRAAFDALELVPQGL